MIEISWIWIYHIEMKITIMKICLGIDTWLFKNYYYIIYMGV